MLYHIKEDQDPVFPMLDGTKVVVPESKMDFRIGPEIPDNQRADAMCVMVERGITERIEQMQPMVPEADHCLLIGHRYSFEAEKEVNAINVTVSMGIALTGHEPDPSIQHTADLGFAARAMLAQIARVSG